MIDNNSLAKVDSHAIADYSGYTPSAVSCADNSLDGENFASQCDKSIPAVGGKYAVTGASLRCSAGQITSADRASR
jgi:hypothetical protein